jgi:sulfatase modifying factor 1
VCVTFCDAFAYCRGVGKRLCGGIGGGAAGFDDFDDASRDQWYNACSAGGVNTYPYGDQYDEQACNGYDNAQSGCQTGGCTTRPGGDVPGCESPVAGYAGVYDLSGNVFEWQDSCNATVDGSDRCRFRGGSFISSYGDDGGNALRCNYDIAGSRDDRYDNLGFRCCGS